MGFRGGAGALNRLLTLQVLADESGAKNTAGELTGEPQDDLSDLRAVFEVAGGREFPEAQKRQSESTARFRIRYRPDINVQRLPETHRAIYVEDYQASPHVLRIFNILWAAVVGRREEIHIEVSEVR